VYPDCTDCIGEALPNSSASGAAAGMACTERHTGAYMSSSGNAEPIGEGPG
jgi:hypothetical protein